MRENASIIKINAYTKDTSYVYYKTQDFLKTITHNRFSLVSKSTAIMALLSQLDSLGVSRKKVVRNP